MNAHEKQFLMTQEKTNKTKGRKTLCSNATLKNLGEGHFLSEIAQ